MKALDNRFVYDLQQRKSESMIALHSLFCISRRSRLQKNKRQLWLQVQVFVVVIRTVRPFRKYSSQLGKMSQNQKPSDRNF